MALGDIGLPAGTKMQHRHFPPRYRKFTSGRRTIVDMPATISEARQPSSQVEEQVVDLIPALRAFARTFTSASFEADDLVQETLLRALRSINQFEPGTSLKSWLFTIMRNAFRTQYKLRKRESPGSTDYAELSIPAAPSQEWSVLNGELRQALGSLTPEHREVLVLVAGFGMSYKEAADICDCAIGTIKSRLSRAREELTVQMHGNPLN